MYYLIKYWISLGLFSYYKKIKIVGIENIPKDKPILFLSNHQNALLDILLIAINCSRKPYFLARADIFKNHFFRPFFYFLQMLPVYRLRDGKSSLLKNEVIFNKCGELLNEGKAILLFPEANHNLKRRVRPLSKGFTRILFSALNTNPNLDVHIIPIGQNYQTPTEMGDRAALNFGKPIRVKDFLNVSEKETIKTEVAKRIEVLTTHIEDELQYGVIVKKLALQYVDYLYPKKINAFLKGSIEIKNLPKYQPSVLLTLTRGIFYLINLPQVFLWRILLKPKVPEAEFMGTFRFGYCMVAYPFFYTIAIAVSIYTYNVKTACLIVIGHAVLNLALVKFGIATSYHRRK
ncbi:lysophospholipid acyltransferase family protein [Croceitalea rosinachiae]|uniref:Lysophospholipid acyltransferase family protein n=1 Tax=Croceitalea rosinachiae TaxID=3075596 RepID=A0ABU3AE04_9FLAO|nr:lysophospholipid acyltransferase family protein [Croceitalea sp. F388]MDT0608219.1 lysophospholipid acyltransferase family protein [Croceitalea sp. F388]